MLGTLAYMAPEQLLGPSVDQRADIFALGVIVMELLTGRRPFSDDPILRVREIEAGVPLSVLPDETARSVLGRCVAFGPEDRYPTVDAMRRDLLAVATSYGSRLRDSLEAASQHRTTFGG